MGTDTKTRRFSERTVRQVRLDSARALVRARLCPDRSRITQIRCMDDHPESDEAFGSQLWYFEGTGIDREENRHSVYGVVEYSLQFGLHELVEDGVFDSTYQRDRFRVLYEREMHRPTWRHPAHHWLAGGVAMATLGWLTYLLVRSIAA